MDEAVKNPQVPQSDRAVPDDAQPVQQALPLAIVQGQPYTELPSDLYIPPDALQIFLEAFEGPLDLLLYLIKRHNLDILDIDVSRITRQYMEYIALMQSLQWELAAEYLVMAAMLAEIKSRSLLPRPPAEAEEGDDPRAELIRRLQTYERFKKAAEDLDTLPRLERDCYVAQARAPEPETVPAPVEVSLQELMVAFSGVLARAEQFQDHEVVREKLSTREKMSQILAELKNGRFVPLTSLLRPEEGRLGVVVTFLAMMELVKEALVDVVQSEMFGPIQLRSRAHG